MAIIAKDIPLKEITLRRYEKPYDLEGRELIKKFCLSIGLLQPGDSRDVVVDVLRVLLEAKKTKKLLDSRGYTPQSTIIPQSESIAYNTHSSCKHLWKFINT